MNKHILWDWDGTLYNPYDTKELYHDSRSAVMELGEMAKLSLVTAGDSAVQWKKIERSGLKKHFHSIRIVPTKPEKRKAFELFLPGQGIVDGSLKPEDIIVVGDRIEFEITFGRQLGYTTVRMLRGPHQRLKPATPLEKANYEIRELSQLIELVKKGRNGIR